MNLTGAEMARLENRNKRLTDRFKASKQRTWQTRGGEVVIDRLVQRTDAAGVPFIEVFLKGETVSESHFRMYNPPSLVPDPNGDIESGGMRFRDDPLAAIAEVISQHGGAKRGRRA